MGFEDLINDAKEFFESYKKEIGKFAKEGKKVIQISFHDLASFSPELSESLIHQPEDTFKLLELALEETGLMTNSRIRLTNLPHTQQINIRRIRTKHLGRLILIEGLIRQSSDVRPQVTNAKFECPNCGTSISVLQIDKSFREPSRCSCGRKGGFKLLQKEMVDAQRIVVEESADNLTGSEQPRRLNVFLKEDLVDPNMEERTTPGSRVKVIGLLKEVAIPLSTGAISTRFDLAIEANNVIPLEEAFNELKITEEDERQILELAADPQLFMKLRESIAPSIFGHEEIKEAMILQLFGGVRRTKSDGTFSRGDIHMLLMGDPGVAKSQLLKFVTKIAPKGRYVSGKATTAAGITATVVKDEFLKGWSLEAGTMVLANKGICALDELEDMGEEDRSALHEAMEQQCMLPNFKLMLSNGKNVKIGPFIDNLMKKNKSKVYNGKDCEILPVNNVELLSTDFKSHFPIKADRISRHLAPREFIKIILANGREITVTPEHPCWIVKDGKVETISAVKLKQNMYFPVPSEIEINSKNYNKINDHLCKILGYHISDGCYELNRGKKVGIQFWNNNESLIKDYKNSIEKYFKIKPGITKRKNQFSVRVISKKVMDYFMKLDKDLMEKGHIKKIPEEIMQLPKENIIYLLRSLYDGDGSVSFQNRGGCRVSFVSQNKELEEQMSDLLLRFGIQSSIFKDNHSKVWRLDISGQENLSRFLMSISFLSQHKRLRLKGYCAKTKTYRTIRDIIPNCTDKINQIFKKLKISARKEIGHQIDLGVEKHRLFLQKLIRIAMNKVMERKGGEASKIRDELLELEKLAFGYSRWVKIKEVSKIPNKNIKWVYDITIEPYHTFISNGMVLHNTITINKANVHATLNSQTAVLAAANPKFGRFDLYQPIASQLNIDLALINRFDLLFVLKDIPEKSKDEAIAIHVLHGRGKSEVKQLIEPELVKKYLAYAKQKIKPDLTEGSIEAIKKFYVDLRNRPSISDDLVKPIPITARQLEALIRLAEANAKARLSSKVTKDDAKKAIRLMKHCLMQVGFDYESKQIDIDRISTGVTASQKSRILMVKEAINRLESRLGKLIPIEELMKEIGEKVDESTAEEIIDKLAIAGDIFKPKRGFIQRM